MHYFDKENMCPSFKYSINIYINILVTPPYHKFVKNIQMIKYYCINRQIQRNINTIIYKECYKNHLLGQLYLVIHIFSNLQYKWERWN